jgi:hypothetical protein
LGFAAVHAIGESLVAPSTDVKGTQFILTPNITHDTSRSYTIIEAQIENTGFETVFVSLPQGWSYDSEVLSAKGEPIITNKYKLHQKYGSPRDKYSFITNHFVFWQRGGFVLSRGAPLTVFWVGGTSFGWYVRPNERLIFTIKMTPSEQEGVIDPFAMEQNRADIRIVEWNQEFYIYPEPFFGFLRAPWIVKNATMVEATPGVFANLSEFPGGRYYDLFELETPPSTTSPPSEVEELTPPAWDEWFTSSSGFFSLAPVSLASLETEFLPIPEINKTESVSKQAEESDELTFIPVWYIDNQFFSNTGIGTTSGKAIRYRYEWKRGREIDGVDVHLFKDATPVTLTEMYVGSEITVSPVSPLAYKELDLTTVPEWYAWF